MTTTDKFTKFNINHDLLTAVRKAKELIDYNSKVESIQEKLNKQLIKTTKPCR